MDWSDHAMWWPKKNIWLDKTRWTLDQYNITADATIYFTPMHKTLKINVALKTHSPMKSDCVAISSPP